MRPRLSYHLPSFVSWLFLRVAASFGRRLSLNTVYRVSPLRTRGLVVMTSPLQGEGRWFDPGRVHHFSSIHLQISVLFPIKGRIIYPSNLLNTHSRYWMIHPQQLWETRRNSSFIPPGPTVWTYLHSLLLLSKTLAIVRQSWKRRGMRAWIVVRFLERLSVESPRCLCFFIRKG